MTTPAPVDDKAIEKALAHHAPTRLNTWRS